MYIDIEDDEKWGRGGGPPPRMDRVIRRNEEQGGLWENRGSSESGRIPKSGVKVERKVRSLLLVKLITVLLLGMVVTKWVWKAS